MQKKPIYLCLAHMSGKEQKYIQEAFNTNWVAPLGPNVNGFEKDLQDFLGNKNQVVALSSGTAAIHLALIELGVTAGDEVICQSFTFSASCNPIVYQGATPVFVDSEKDTWNINPVLLETAIKDRIKVTGKKPKAIIPVHLYGMPAKMNEITEIANRYNIPVLEDAAEALGSEYKGQKCGTFGCFSTLSFNGNKMITTSGGGALICRSQEDKKLTMFYATQAREPFPYYQHKKIGYNYRMSNICAGIGRGQMTVLNRHIAHHRHIHKLYESAFAEIKGIDMHRNPSLSFNSNYWLSSILIDPQITGFNYDDIRLALQAENIESRPLWKPMHMQPVFKNAPKYVDGTAEHLFNKGLCLPSGPMVTDKDVQRVTDIITKFIIRTPQNIGATILLSNTELLYEKKKNKKADSAKMNYIRLYSTKDKSTWDKIVLSFTDYDAFWLSGYAKSFEIHGDGKACLLYYEKNGLRAIYVYMKKDLADIDIFSNDIQKEMYFDIKTPYGYGGFLFDGETSDSNLKEFKNSYITFMKQNNIISNFVRYHPVIKNAVIMKRFNEVTDLGNTISMDLTSKEIIWANIIPKKRNGIRIAERNGVIIKHSKDKTLFNTFTKLYNATMDRDNADGYYYFKQRFYDSINENLYNNHEIFYAEYEGKIIVMSLILFANKTMYCFLSASDFMYRKLSPNNLLLYKVACWGFEHGFSSYHIGGGVGSSTDNLFKFKKGFNRNSVENFSVGKEIYNKKVYDYLIKIRVEKDNKFNKESTFFPLYRESL